VVQVIVDAPEVAADRSGRPAQKAYLASAESGFRPDIQGLRAIAVMVVVLYHLWPSRIKGGYVGVDVFFVISGFLITSHLWREVQVRGSIQMRTFYARRALRLLPAAILVLICTAIACYFILPSARWDNTFNQLVASAAYVQNWVLAHNSVDYLLQWTPDSPVQHFWSLSAEEQFYAFWPLLIVVAVWVVSRIRRQATITVRRRAVMAALTILLLASFAYSVYDTAIEPKQAYFITPTRVWEFAVGALCGLLVLDAGKWHRARAVLGWLGIAGILAASLFYVKATPFPGYAAALPVLSTAAVILAARKDSPLSASWWLSLRPATMVGDISYAIYLWHWPLLVLVPVAWKLEALNFATRVSILAATFALSLLSTHLIENPLCRNNFLRTRRWPSLAIALTGVAAMVAASTIAASVVQARIDAAAARFSGVAAAGTPCQGAAVFDPANNCPSKLGEGPIMSPALAIKYQGDSGGYEICDTALDKVEIESCQFGPKDSPIRVALVGDSHALHWLGTVTQLGREGKWFAKTYYKASCPFSDAVRVIPSEPKEWRQHCIDWSKKVTAEIVSDDAIDYVIVAAYGSAYNFIPADGSPATANTAAEGWLSMWKRITDSGKRIVVMRDTPTIKLKPIPECVEREFDDLYKCNVPRSEGTPPDPFSDIAKQANDPNIRTMDLTRGFCDENWCYGVAGNIIVYCDTHHLSWHYAESLAPLFWAEFQKAIADMKLPQR